MLRRFLRKSNRFNSADYWETRYKSGGNSGSGSYNDLAEFKAGVLNNAVIEYKLNSIIEFGCGDGNQLSLYKMPRYIGMDVSQSVLQRCIKIFEHDDFKSFFLYSSKCFSDKAGIFKSDAAISIDVLFHLVEQDVYEAYLAHLFGCAEKLVIIYAADMEFPPKNSHELYRKFTSYIAGRFPEWKLDQHIKNKYPSKKYEDEEGSLADFYFYSKKI